eukprot:gene21303-278_t
MDERLAAHGLRRNGAADAAGGDVVNVNAIERQTDSPRSRPAPRAASIAPIAAAQSDEYDDADAFAATMPPPKRGVSQWAAEGPPQRGATFQRLPRGAAKPGISPDDSRGRQYPGVRKAQSEWHAPQTDRQPTTAQETHADRVRETAPGFGEDALAQTPRRHDAATPISPGAKALTRRPGARSPDTHNGPNTE